VFVPNDVSLGGDKPLIMVAVKAMGVEFREGGVRWKEGERGRERTLHW